jgi:DNA-binding MarR family transcriptional regulator
MASAGSSGTVGEGRAPRRASALPAAAAGGAQPAGTRSDEGLYLLAGDLRAEVNRLAYHLRAPATRSGISPTRLAALAALAHADSGLRAGDLAVRMGITPASTSRLIDILVEAGWADRERDPEDARAVLLTVTERGRRQIEELRRDNVANLAADLASLEPAERAVLAAAVPLLRTLSERLTAAH